MSNLSAFLAQNVIKDDKIKYVASKRFLDQDKKPVEWEVKGLTSAEDEMIRKACTKKVPVTGKRGQFTQETDYNQYLGKLAAACTVFPNLNDVELQNSYGIMGADALLKTMLKPGEYADYLAKVQEVNGFEVSMEELVDEAKNS
ncbi:MAG: XkdN-like protein [Clostridia bacterium]|jgi:hypothetical protein|nr:XkdN-like protein [Clostridia bacterium]